MPGKTKRTSLYSAIFDSKEPEFPNNTLSSKTHVTIKVCLYRIKSIEHVIISLENVFLIQNDNV